MFVSEEYFIKGNHQNDVMTTLMIIDNSITILSFLLFLIKNSDNNKRLDIRKTVWCDINIIE